MEITWYVIISWIAAACIAIFSMPQVIHTVKTRDTEKIHLSMYLIFWLGSFCFFAYGLGASIDTQKWLDFLSVWLANLFSLACATIILSYKIHNMICSKKAKLTEAQYIIIERKKRIEKKLAEIKEENAN